MEEFPVSAFLSCNCQRFGLPIDDRASIIICPQSDLALSDCFLANDPSCPLGSGEECPKRFPSLLILRPEMN